MTRGILPILLVISLNVEGGEPRRVLLIHSFGQEFQPFITFSADFHSGLARESSQPVDFLDVALAGARFESREEGAFVDYLGALFAGHRLDLVVPMGAPAVGFAQKYRARLFPDTPMLLASVDQRMVQSSMLTTNDAVIAVRHDVRLLVEAMLQLMPDTTNVVMVFGNSPLERFWADAFMRESQLPANHLGCESFSGLSFEKMKQRAAALPRGSVMLFGDLLVDGDGIPQTGDEALANLHAAANAPIFGIHDFQLGHGIVGGPLIPVHELARQSASAAARILGGESPASFRPPPMGPAVPTYDWRELRQWNISEDRLPPGSVIKFREPTIWARFRNWIIGGTSLLVIQGVLIGALVTNLARRRKAERSLRENDERMKLAASAAEMCLWELDFATDRVWVAGPLAERIGQKDRDAHYAQVFQGIHPDDQNRVATALKEARMGAGDFESVHRRVLPDGKIVWVAARGRVEFDHAQRPLRIRGISMDITARKEAEERARENEGKFLVMANSTPVIMWATGPDKLCTFCNQACVDFTGRPLEQQLGTGWAENLHAEDRAGCLKLFAEAFDARQPFTMEYRVRRHDGQYRWLSSHAVPRYDLQHNFLGYIGSCVDLTERKQAEAEARHSREELAHVSRVSVLGQLAGSLAHELNQPLTAVVSSAEAAHRLIKGGCENREDLLEAVKDIAEQGQRAGDIIAGMRAMLKKDVGQMAVQDINLVVKQVLEMVRSDLMMKGVSPVLRLDPQLPPVNGHAVQLRQVLLNLVMNACDAMSDVPADRRSLTIETKRLTPAEVEVSVADAGPGFAEDILQHAFEPFRTTKAKGLGLGLAICRSIIAIHGGRLVASNNDGKGAILRFTLRAHNGSGICG
jgi:PAS domain S-box-containing protein